MYSLSHFGQMITDRVRMEAFVEALRLALPEGGVFLDIGAGTGIFSLIACQLGASKVYAIEPNPLVQLVGQMAAANGFTDKVAIIHDVSTRVSLTEKADVAIADLRGHIPLFQHKISTMYDVRQRLLKPEGTLIPMRDRLYAAFVSAPDQYSQRYEQPWVNNVYQLDMRPALSLLINQTAEQFKVTPEMFVLDPQLWTTLNYGIDSNPNVVNSLEWEAKDHAAAHFIVCWFETELYPGVGFTMAPGAEGAKVYGRLFLPLEAPITFEQGDHVRLTLSAHLVSDKYLYGWETIVRTSANPPVVKAHYRQNTFLGEFQINLSRRSPQHIIRLSDQAHLLKFALDQIHDEITVAELAQRLYAAFPDSFPTEADAFSAAADIAHQFSRSS